MKIQRPLATESARALALLSLLAAATFAPAALRAQARTEYRAFWVDTFNTALNNHADVLAVVGNAKAAKANAIFVQVRRRGDSWYLDSLEPAPDFVPLAAGFDPLRDIIEAAHAEGLEVHAFVIMSAVWSKNPNFAPSPTLGRPVSPNHVFNQHGGYNPATQQIAQGPNNWLTRTLLPDGAAGVSFQGHRVGNDFWLDFGHPDAAKYTVDVVMRLVRNYDIDGLHLDRIRYPEIGVAGQTPTTGANIGYNATSVERFQRASSLPAGSPAPAPGNPQWAQWRRDQVTNVVRRVYLEALAVKPRLKVSAALIAFGGAPTCNPGANCKAVWESAFAAEAYWRVYQDWRAWTQEGIIDIAIPMAYKAEHAPAQVTQYNQWDAWLRANLYDRAGVTGQGAANNAVEGTLRQVRRTLTPESGPTSLSGVIFFSMATSNIAVANNPFAQPTPASTVARPFAEFAAGLTTGKSVNGVTRYEPSGLTPIFEQAAAIPSFAWKTAPTKGHFKGEAFGADDKPLDTAAVQIENLDTHETRQAKTDGNGFFGAVDLQPGPYRAQAGASYFCFNVVPGLVADAARDAHAPATVAAASGVEGQNGWHTSDVTLSLSATDACAGVASTEYSTDGGQTWQPYAGAFTLSGEGTHVVLYRSADAAGNAETAQSLVVKIDNTAPTLALTATPSVIWPANNKPFDVSLGGEAADAVSGLASVSYVVVDEYGAPLSLPARTLDGAASQWAETLTVEASRRGDDSDGRLYRVTATVTDLAGNTSTAAADIVVPHDRRPR